MRGLASHNRLHRHVSNTLVCLFELLLLDFIFLVMVTHSSSRLDRIAFQLKNHHDFNCYSIQTAPSLESTVLPAERLDHSDNRKCQC